MVPNMVPSPPNTTGSLGELTGASYSAYDPGPVPVTRYMGTACIAKGKFQGRKHPDTIFPFWKIALAGPA